ncbi:hypothetical protein G7075_15350 [Phycicoccus sp. HDW14]|uniref:hypothetical protein n=1 Tax=Phycicoccus sp. HDW14 TaxID=2714941 RepID=UPI00140DC15A|nr:hypothetical protein [Phycicoccus sp. HDW14]QIM22193.1 hypothetical protein G7075_15350 [Phycicoccus sp. HDW14]
MPTTIGLILIIAVVVLAVVGVVWTAVKGGRRRTEQARGSHPDAPHGAETAAMQADRQADRGGML